MSISNYLEDAILNQVFNGTSFAVPAALWASLHTGDPGETGISNPLASAPRFALSFGAAASATAANDATASVVVSATGTLTHMGIWDGSSTATANHLWSGTITPNVTVANAGDTVTVAVGAVTVSLS